MFKKKWASAAALVVLGGSLLSACSEQKPQVEVAEQAPVAQPVLKASVEPIPKGKFANPLFANGADPWLEYWDGNYYLTTTTWTSQLVMRKAPTLDGLATAEPVNVWSDDELSRCCNFWAFEFHRLNGPNGWRWYLMYTSGQHGTLDYQHLSVLESVADDPMGPYEYKGEMMPDSWNIDGSYLEHNGQLYLLWSEWVGDEQLNWISKMTTPWSIEGPRVILTRPEEEWEKSGRKVNEGAEILKRDGRTFLIYSASFCDTPDYKLAMKELTGDDPMNPDHWTKYPEPVFQRGNGVYGPGHNGFFTSPDGTEDWIVYHGNSKETDGCSSTRSVRAQKFTWNEDGTPNFGEPVPEGELLDLPSGENGPLATKLQGAHMQLVSGEQCLVVEAEGLQAASCDASASKWVFDPTADGYYRFGHLESGHFLGQQTGQLTIRPWENLDTQRWQLVSSDAGNGLYRFKNRQTGEWLSKPGCSAESCNEWRLQPVDGIAIASVQSGRVLQACDASGNVDQGSWKNQRCQTWSFTSVDAGFYHLKRNEQCLTVEAETIVPGTNVALGDCDTSYAQWRLAPDAMGNYALVNRESQHVLNLDACALGDGANISQTQAFDIPCQAFQLRHIPSAVLTD